MELEDVHFGLDRNGYAIVHNVLTPDQLEVARKECDTLQELAQPGAPASPWAVPHARSSCIFETVPGALCTENPTLRSSYEAYKAARTAPPLSSEAWDILFNANVATLALHVLGPTATLYNDQYIVKPSRNYGGARSSFAWHRDCDCLKRQPVKRRPSISLWLALDDIKFHPSSEENGGLKIKAESHIDPELAEQLMEDGIINGIRVDLIRLHAGDAVIMRDNVSHMSGPNNSQYTRRAWMPQFSAGGVVWEESGEPVSLAIDLVNGSESEKEEAAEKAGWRFPYR